MIIINSLRDTNKIKVKQLKALRRVGAKEKNNVLKKDI